MTGDQSLPDQPPARQPGADLAASQAAGGGGSPTGLPGEMFAKPDPDQPETPPEQSAPGREADADSATLGH